MNSERGAHNKKKKKKHANTNAGRGMRKTRFPNAHKIIQKLYFLCFTYIGLLVFYAKLTHLI